MPAAITTARASRKALLLWYDGHHRDLPWRVPPDRRRAGVRPDPYRVWLSEVMLQQTTVAAASGHYLRFTARWPDVHALAAASRDDVLSAWAGLGYYARARNLHRCAGIVSRDLNGLFPDDEAGLARLPGIGPYTAAAIAAIAFDRQATVVDGNVERVMARLFAETDPLPGVKPRLRARAAELTPADRPGDYAQAVMDLGATVCTPARPACGLCPWRETCRGRIEGIAETLPRRSPKKAKPIRQGAAWVVLDVGGRVLTVRRAERGLLGGMLSLPSTEWTPPEAGDGAGLDQGRDSALTGLCAAGGAGCLDLPPNVDGPAGRSVGEVRHTFTHFHLRLQVRMIRLAESGGEDFVPLEQAMAAMPTLFAKACRLATAAESSR